MGATWLSNSRMPPARYSGKARRDHNLQVSDQTASNLNFRTGDGCPAKSLAPFAKSAYLHQVLERGHRDWVRYIGLPARLAQKARLIRDPASPSLEVET